MHPKSKVPARFFTCVVIVLLVYLTARFLPNPRLYKHPDFLYWGAIFQYMGLSLYTAADMAYLLLLTVSIWLAGRWRWSICLALIPFCVLGLARYHPDFMHGHRASVINACTVSIIAIATVPIARRLNQSCFQIEQISILDMFLGTTLFGIMLAYIVYSMQIPESDDMWWPYSSLRLLEHSVQTILNVGLACIVGLLCIRRSNIGSYAILALMILLRWSHSFIIYDDDDGIYTDFMDSFDWELVSIWWMPITLEFLFLILCLQQMWRYSKLETQ